jgi:(heptosyl)LPS beta-1,4-glucosyltransferase
MPSRPTIGGFVIHGNSVGTLGRCLDSLLAVCDHVVAIDSESTDGSADVVRQRGARHVVVPWQGYGAARAAAVHELPQTDYVFFLDSDEWLEPETHAAFAAWRDASPSLPQYTVTRRDWADLGGRRFLFRGETRVRLVRRDHAVWAPQMIVHEALPRRERRPLGVRVEHDFAATLDGVRDKQREYAFLWAVRAFGEGKQSRSPLGRRLLHLLRNAVLKGALFRGGTAALRLAWAVAAYHVDKYRFLATIEQGEHADAVDAWRKGRLGELFVMAKESRDPGSARQS